MKILDLGRMNYNSAWDIQKEYHRKVLSGKEPDILLIVEHDPVYTLGRNANDNHFIFHFTSKANVNNYTLYLKYIK